MLKGFLGTDLVIPLQLEDGETNLYPQVHIFDNTGTEIASSPFDMSHISAGLYEYTWTPLAAKQYIAQFKVYTDAAHTTLSTNYVFANESILIEIGGNVQTLNVNTVGK